MSLECCPSPVRFKIQNTKRHQLPSVVYHKDETSETKERSMGQDQVA